MLWILRSLRNVCGLPLAGDRLMNQLVCRKAFEGMNRVVFEYRSSSVFRIVLYIRKLPMRWPCWASIEQVDWFTPITIPQ